MFYAEIRIWLAIQNYAVCTQFHIAISLRLLKDEEESLIVFSLILVVFSIIFTIKVIYFQ